MAATSSEPGRFKGRKSFKDLTDGEGSISSNDKEYEDDMEVTPRKRLKRERVSNDGEFSLHHRFDFIEQFDSSPGEPAEEMEDNDQDYVPNGKASRIDTNGNQAYMHAIAMEPVGVGEETTGRKGPYTPPTRGSSRTRRSCGGGRHLSYSNETDRRLLDWVMDRDKHRLPVSREAIQEMARILIRKELPEFKASSGWVEKFLNRHNLNLPNKATMLENGITKNGTLPVPSAVEPETVNGHPAESFTSSSSPHNVEKPLTPEEEKPVESVVENKPVVIKQEEVDFASVPINRRGPGRKRIIRDFRQEEEEEEEEIDEVEKIVTDDLNPERLKAFNMFVRLFVDENLDRLVPISKQPKDKVLAIIHACQRQFPEFRDRARKRIRTYLKSCRRLKKLKEPLRRTADQINTVPSMSSAQMQEVNNILASACANEADLGDTQLPTMATQPVLATAGVTSQQSHGLGRPPPLMTNGRVTSPVGHVDHQPPINTTRNSTTTTTTTSQQCVSSPPQAAAQPAPRSGGPSPLQRLTMQSGGAPESLAVARAKAGTEYKLNTTEVSAIRQLIASYRESAAFLYRSADELEALLPSTAVQSLTQKVLQ